jgi:hypothetical protein
MSRLATLRLPCVHDSNYYAALRVMKTLVKFNEDTDVRYNANVQKPGHSVIYVDVHEFIDEKFGADFRALENKDCLRVYLSNKAYVLVGIGKSQEQCDAEVEEARLAKEAILKAAEGAEEAVREASE